MAPGVAGAAAETVGGSPCNRSHQSCIVRHAAAVDLRDRSEPCIGLCGGDWKRAIWRISVDSAVFDQLVVAMRANVVQVERGLRAESLLDLQVPFHVSGIADFASREKGWRRKTRDSCLQVGERS